MSEPTSINAHECQCRQYHVITAAQFKTALQTLPSVGVVSVESTLTGNPNLSPYPPLSFSCLM